MSKGLPTDVTIGDLEWIRFREDTLGEHAYEPTESKLIKKFKENPLVPIGAMATICCLTYGLWSFRKGRQRQSQNMMRARIFAQGFTVVAILGGCFLGIGGSDPSPAPPK